MSIWRGLRPDFTHKTRSITPHPPNTPAAALDAGQVAACLHLGEVGGGEQGLQGFVGEGGQVRSLTMMRPGARATMSIWPNTAQARRRGAGGGDRGCHAGCLLHLYASDV